MAPTLRLTTADRPLLRFGRRNTLRHMEVDVQYLPTASDQLPSISRLDTRSFINLFEKFHDLESHHDNPKQLNIMDGSRSILLLTSSTQMTLDSPISPQDALHSHGNTTTMASMPLQKAKRRLSPVIRGDSNASSASSVPTDNETFSRNSRRSSKSSFTPAVELSPAKPVSPRGWRAKKKFSVSHPNLLTTRNFPPTDDKENVHPGAGSPSANKPLPPAPLFDLGSVFAAVGMDPEQRQGENRTTARPNRPATPIRPSTRHTKSASVGDCPTLSAARNERPTSPPTSRGARLGKAISRGVQRRQSDSFAATPIDNASLSKPRMKAPPPQKRSKTHSTMASIHAADQVRLQIMRELHDLKDLRSTALISRRFYRTFKQHESTLVSDVLRKESPPAWEMLQIVSEDPNCVSVRTYRDYKRTLDSLRVTILMQCETDLKEETFAGLIGSDAIRRQRIDQALWRIWVFCERFGRQDEKQRDLQAQIDWLNGGKSSQHTDAKQSYGRGNVGGLTIAELEDISEMWNCLNLLLKGFQNRVDEALLAGILSQYTIDETRTEEWYACEWIQHLLCLGPSVISSISSCSFEHANALGLTSWVAPGSRQESRSMFLKAAITAVYQERVVAEATLKAAQMSLPIRATQRLSKSEATLTVRARKLQELPAINTGSRPSQEPASPLKRKPVAQRPRISSAPLFGPSPAQTQSESSVPQRSSMALPTASNSTMYHSLSMTPTASTRLGATLFPMDTQNRRASQIPILPSPQLPSQSPAMPPTPHPWDPPEDVVVDPVDKAMARLVNELGFSAADVKRALASCDTGFGMDVDRAIGMLTAETEGRAVRPNRRSVSSTHAHVGGMMRSPEPRRRDDAGLCDNCGCTSPRQRHQQQQQQPQEHHDPVDANALPSATSPTEERELGDSLGELFLQSCSPTSASKTLTRRISTAKAYKVLGVDVKRSNSGSGKAKAGRFGSMRLKPSPQSQTALVKTLSRNMGTIKMPRVSLGMGAGMNLNLATLGLGRDREREQVVGAVEGEKKTKTGTVGSEDGCKNENKTGNGNGRGTGNGQEQGVYAGLM